MYLINKMLTRARILPLLQSSFCILQIIRRHRIYGEQCQVMLLLYAKTNNQATMEGDWIYNNNKRHNVTKMSLIKLGWYLVYDVLDGVVSMLTLIRKIMKLTNRDVWLYMSLHVARYVMRQWISSYGIQCKMHLDAECNIEFRRYKDWACGRRKFKVIK